MIKAATTHLLRDCKIKRRKSKKQFVGDAEGSVVIPEIYRQAGYHLWECRQDKKHPDLGKGFFSCKRPFERVAFNLLYNKMYPGFVLEIGSNCLVVDVDMHDGHGINSVRRLEATIGVSLQDVCSFKVRTAGDGYHLYFAKSPDDNFAITHVDYPEIEMRHGRHLIVGAGSIFSYGTYELLTPEPELVEAPRALIDYWTGIAPAKKKRSSDHVEWDGVCNQSVFAQSTIGLDVTIEAMRGAGYEVWKETENLKEGEEPIYLFRRPGGSSQMNGKIGMRSQYGNFQLVSFSNADPNFEQGQSRMIRDVYTILAHGSDYTASYRAIRGMGLAPSGGEVQE